MFLAIVTSRGVAKATASRDLADLAVEHLRRRVWRIATRGEAEKAIRDALAAAEMDARLRTVKLGPEHGPGDERPFMEQKVVPRARATR